MRAGVLGRVRELEVEGVLPDSSEPRFLGPQSCRLACCPSAATELGGICFALSEELPPPGIWSADPTAPSIMGEVFF